MRPRDIRLWNWLLVAMGGKGIIYWCYHTEATGMESTGFGLVDRDGSPTERVLEAAEDHRLIESNWDIIKDYRPKPEVAILVDLDNALPTFAMSGQGDASVDSFRGYYKALWNCDLVVDFIEPKNLNNNRYRVIIAPWHLIGKKGTCEQLRQFVEAGGTLLIETGFGTYDEHMIFNPQFHHSALRMSSDTARVKSSTWREPVSQCLKRMVCQPPSRYMSMGT
jgi:beta-galactosidase